MTAGIQGTGPYAKLKNLRRQVQDIKYEIEWFAETPRKLRALNQRLDSVRQEITVVNAEIKAAKAVNA